MTKVPRIKLVTLPTNIIGLRMTEILELGITVTGLVNSWAVLFHDISLFLSAVAEFERVKTLEFLEDSVTGNLLIHISQVSQVVL